MSLAQTMRDVQNDCATDAIALDSTPFTPRGIGETLGTMLAMIQAVAKGVELLAEQLDPANRTETPQRRHEA